MRQIRKEKQKKKKNNYNKQVPLLIPKINIKQFRFKSEVRTYERNLGWYYKYQCHQLMKPFKNKTLNHIGFFNYANQFGYT